MFKKIFIFVLALTVFMVPATALAASKVTAGKIIYYEGKIDTNTDWYYRLIVKTTKINDAVALVQTGNAKRYAKIIYYQKQMNTNMEAAKRGLNEANILLNDLSVNDPKSELKVVKRKIKALQKNLKKAENYRSELKDRLTNLGIKI